MSDSFETSRGTVFEKVSEDYVSVFYIDEMPEMNGIFFEHLLGMYRFLGQNTQLASICHDLSSNLKTAKEKREEAHKAADEECARKKKEADSQYIAEVNGATVAILPQDDGNGRCPKIIEQDVYTIKMSYTIKTYNESTVEPKLLTIEHEG
jgi:hypothetical protein